MNEEPQEFGETHLDKVSLYNPWRTFTWMTVVLLIAFSAPLFHLARFAATSGLYSYILLIPFVSGYLVWMKKRELTAYSGPARVAAAGFSLCGVGTLGGYALASHAGLQLTEDSFLAWMVMAFVLFLAGVCCWSFGKDIARKLVFPVSFLVFMAPVPPFLLNEVELFLQIGSAFVAGIFFHLTGATFYFHDLTFELPTIALHVAPECSGIRSSLVLLITSLIAGQLFLRSSWKEAVLFLSVIPLALLRNGFRIFVIGKLCTYIGPEMIDSPIHRRGGSLFFALSLIPFSILLVCLWKSEQRTARRQDTKMVG